MHHKDIDGKAVSGEILGQVRDAAQALVVAGWPPRLVSILMRNTVIAEKRQRAHYESELGQTGAALRP